MVNKEMLDIDYRRDLEESIINYLAAIKKSLCVMQ